MKLLEEFYDLSEAEEIANKLENKGILTFISSKRSLHQPMRLGGTLTVGLWIVLNNQYSDAVSLLKDKKHIVTSALSPEEITTLKEQSKSATFSTFNNFIAYSILVICLILGGVYFAAK
ncbi:hypothetical protein [uncultured Cocleimonas sp.]|uniref:hypothetical protein n=1 Tax=uncultured Cocleimonas sp. TaxID=1051587 RepID=UPI002636C334|nr:hypothetical protein [uncultured Cocleimonas sp.]